MIPTVNMYQTSEQVGHGEQHISLLYKQIFRNPQKGRNNMHSQT